MDMQVLRFVLQVLRKDLNQQRAILKQADFWVFIRFAHDHLMLIKFSLNFTVDEVEML